MVERTFKIVLDSALGDMKHGADDLVGDIAVGLHALPSRTEVHEMLQRRRIRWSTRIIENAALSVDDDVVRPYITVCVATEDYSTTDANVEYVLRHNLQAAGMPVLRITRIA